MAREGGKASFPGMHMAVRGQPVRMAASLSTTWVPEIKFGSLCLETSALNELPPLRPSTEVTVQHQSPNTDCLALGQKPP